MRVKTWNALRVCVALCMVWRGTAGAPAPETTAPATSAESANTDFLSDEQWLQLPREARQARFNQAFLARIEPTGYGAVEKLGDYIERARRAVILDSRLAVFDVRATVLDARQRRIALTGEVSLSQYRTGLENTLRSLGFSVARNDVTVLPAAGLGKAVYAVSTTFSATMRREPRARAEQVNSIALGWPMRLLRQARPDDLTTTGAAAVQGDRAGRRGRRSTAGAGTETSLPVDQWLLAQSAEGYLGFVRNDEIRRVETYRLPDSILVLPTTATLAGRPALVLPTGTGLRKLAEGRWAVPLATGDIEIDLSDRQVAHGTSPLDETRILDTARPLMGTKYVWGGVTHLGIDCSGFTQFIYRCVGVQLPRDADEQALGGVIVAFGRDVATAARAGDLIFFVNERGRVSHVALSLGGNRVIHSSQRDVHISTLDEMRGDSDVPLIDRVLYARRVVGW